MHPVIDYWNKLPERKILNTDDTLLDDTLQNMCMPSIVFKECCSMSRFISLYIY